MRARTLAALAFSLFALATPAQVLASPIYVSNIALSNGYESVTLKGGVFGAGATYYAGQQHLTANAGTTDVPAAHYDIYAWCVDVFHANYLGANSIVYQTGTLANNGNGAALTAEQVGKIGWLAAYGNQQLAKGADSIVSAAVQTMIWNVEYGSTYAGANAAITAELNHLASLLPASPSVGTLALISSPNGQGIQSQSLVTPAPVPEPAAASLLVVAIAALGLVRRRAYRRGAARAA